jgi:glucosamine--fructose-6-phosphate aminotransferase (isomerizing)
MRAEIFEQPETLSQLIERARPVLNAVAVQAHQCTFAMLAARGSSDNASTYGKYLLESLCGLPTALAAPSLYTLYRKPPRLKSALVIGVSQSGAAADVIAVLDEGRAQGAVTLAITNTAGSPMTQAAEHVLLLEAGLEQALAATKTVTGQCTAYALLAAAISNDTTLKTQLLRLPAMTQAILQRDSTISTVAHTYKASQTLWVIGRGYAYSAAEEIALKLKETCFIYAEAFSAADFLHGPLATLETGDDVMVLLSDDETLPTTVQFVERVLTRGARVLLVASEVIFKRDNVKALTHAAQTEQILTLALPDMPSLINNIGFIVAGQLFAMHLSLAKGHNPDVSRGVTKVTVTQ